jgi:hypothetical protein
MIPEAVWASENLRLPAEHFVDFLAQVELE